MQVMMSLTANPLLSHPSPTKTKKKSKNHLNSIWADVGCLSICMIVIKMAKERKPIPDKKANRNAIAGITLTLVIDLVAIIL